MKIPQFTLMIETYAHATTYLFICFTYYSVYLHTQEL